MARRTKAQRRWIRKGYRYEMIPLRSTWADGARFSYILGASESWRAGREFARDVLGMPVRPICKPMIHNGRKFR
jgi:hypothetical protein